VDGGNAWHSADIERPGLSYPGIGRGTRPPPAALVEDVTTAFRAVETGVANEVETLLRFLNRRFARDAFNEVRFSEVQRIAGTCVTGCAIANPGPVARVSSGSGFVSQLATLAVEARA
jgi:hypothetical protein